MTDKAKNPGGRPTKLTDAMVDLAFKYLDDSAKEWEDREEPRAADEEEEGTKNSHKQIMVTVKKRPRLANHARLALTLGINQDTMYEWTKPHEADDENMVARRAKFSECLKSIADLQEVMLIENGVNGEYSSQVANRILAAKHGYKEKIDSTTLDKAIQPSGTTIIAASEDVQKAVAAFEEALRPKRP